MNTNNNAEIVQEPQIGPGARMHAANAIRLSARSLVEQLPTAVVRRLAEHSRKIQAARDALRLTQYEETSSATKMLLAHFNSEF